MSYCRKEGKDTVVFVTKEDHDQPSSNAAVAAFSQDMEDEPGLITDEGDINWNCPCLGGMATGPCGYEFREAFSCFHYSDAEPKGSDCFEPFREMQTCMAKYPDLYADTDKAEQEELMEGEPDSLDSNGEQSTKDSAEEKVEKDNTKEEPASSS